MLLDKPLVTVDREAGTAYVTLTDTMIVKTVPFAEDVVVDVDKDNAIESVELLSLDTPVDLDEMARQFVLPADVRSALEGALADIRGPAAR